MGELLYRLKNRGDQTVIPEIVDTAATFLNAWGVRFDVVVPVPPSNTTRKRQPVVAVAQALSEKIGVPVCEAVIHLKRKEKILHPSVNYSLRGVHLDGS